MSWTVKDTDSLVEAGERKRRRGEEDLDAIVTTDSGEEDDIDADDASDDDATRSDDDDGFITDDDDLDEDESDDDDQLPPKLSYEAVIASDLSYNNHGLEIRTSTIPAFGLGIFAARDFEAGEPITLYTGQVISHADALVRLENADGDAPPTHINDLIRGQWMIDGLRHPNGAFIGDPRVNYVGRGIGAFVNSSKGTNKTANAEFDIADAPPNEELLDRLFNQPTSAINAGSANDLDPNQRLKYVRALRAIEAGEEIWVDYKVLLSD